MQAKTSLKHISKNKREHARKDYYKTDNSSIVKQVETQVTEIDINQLSNRVAELSAIFQNNPNLKDDSLEFEYNYKQNLLIEIGE